MIEARLGTVDAMPLEAWIRVGTAATQINPIGLYTGGGITFGAEGSRVGLAIASAKLGEQARRGPPVQPADHETSIEFTYEHRISRQLLVQPDVQYIVNPGWDRALNHALVAGIRVILTI
jgi:porin